jgi:hypothetical protein
MSQLHILRMCCEDTQKRSLWGNRALLIDEPFCIPTRTYNQIFPYLFLSCISLRSNLSYCMSAMVESEKACTEGIGFLAYMNDWKMENFSVNYCLQFMQMLQGKNPVRVRLFLIVNPPGWFGKIWAIMKPMLAPDFRKKVHMIPESRLNEFLADGYQQYAPDDMEGGQQNTEQLVRDFITYRKLVESI